MLCSLWKNDEMSTFIVPFLYTNVSYHTVLKVRCRSVDNLMLGVK